jgi:hypothetical protein
MAENLAAVIERQAANVDEVQYFLTHSSILPSLSSPPPALLFLLSFSFSSCSFLLLVLLVLLVLL